jgi:uncharacterized protein YkwD
MRRLLILLLALALAACAGHSGPPPIAEQMKALEMRLFLVVEEKRHRLEERAKPLRLDPQLTAAALQHADAMAKAHAMDGKNGDENPAIKALMADPKFQGFVGENVAQQFYHSRQGIDVDKFAQTFLDLWLNSEGQKRNLTFYAFNRAGIGLATDGKAIFVSVIFATDLGLPPRPDMPVEPDPEEIAQEAHP